MMDYTSFLSELSFWEGIGLVALRCGIAVIIGMLIGLERSLHGRAAGMRTHVLVCLGAALTAMTGIYVSEISGGGDVLRLAAQVISGVGFLGAGMIILKNDNMITGLTTAAGVWATATVGIAIGYGFYVGAVIASVFFIITLIFFQKMERNKKNTLVIYVEVEDMTKLNSLLDEIKAALPTKPIFRVYSPVSGCAGHVGVDVVMDRRKSLAVEDLLKMDGVVFAIEA